jgi:ABC-type uncharacterized transport system permease subunit
MDSAFIVTMLATAVTAGTPILLAALGKRWQKNPAC